MRLKQALLCGFSALALAAGSAFAGDQSASYERSDPAFSYSELSGLERYDALPETSSYEPVASSESVDTETPFGG